MARGTAVLQIGQTLLQTFLLLPQLFLLLLREAAEGSLRGRSRILRNGLHGHHGTLGDGPGLLHGGRRSRPGRLYRALRHQLGSGSITLCFPYLLQVLDAGIHIQLRFIEPLPGLLNGNPEMLDLLGVLRQLLQPTLQIQGTQNGKHHVLRKEGIEHGVDHHKAEIGPVPGNRLHMRMQHPDDEYRQNAPEHRCRQTDVAVKIQRLVGIVPPLHFKDMIHNKAGGQLQQGAAHQANQKHQQQLFPEGPGQQHQKRGPGAVDREPGPVTEAPVQKSSGFQTGIHGLEEPAQHAVAHEKYGPLQEAVALHGPHG